MTSFVWISIPITVLPSPSPPSNCFPRSSYPVLHRIVKLNDALSDAIADLPPSQPCDPRISAEDLWLRLDTQTLRKLPRTNAIIFGVHPVMARLGDFADVPLVPALLEKVHREADPTLIDVRLLTGCLGEEFSHTLAV
jgi:hypothetical protein